MKSKRKKESGEELFHQYYEGIWKERWAGLVEEMRKKRKHVALYNPYSKEERIGPVWQGLDEVREACHFTRPEAEGILPYYLMDAASLLAPMALDIKKGQRVLDLCAAPGGKSLFMAFTLDGSGELIANDKSRERRDRLKRVLSSYLPEDKKVNVKVTGHDASSWCLHETEAYDKILLDAPCSSERHLIEKPHHLKDWKSGRTKRLGMNQWTMLASALQVLKVGGRLVYSTCSVSSRENDDVVSKVVKKFGDRISWPEIDLPLLEKTDYGYIALPDRSDFGPFYLSVMEKNR